MSARFIRISFLLFSDRGAASAPFALPQAADVRIFGVTVLIAVNLHLSDMVFFKFLESSFCWNHNNLCPVVPVPVPDEPVPFPRGTKPRPKDL